MDGLIANARTILGLGYVLMRYGRRIGHATMPGPEQLKELNTMTLRLIGLLMWLAPLAGVIYAVYDYFTR